MYVKNALRMILFVSLLIAIRELEGSLKMFGEKMKTRWKTVVSKTKNALNRTL